jgi:hypothetical protein
MDDNRKPRQVWETRLEGARRRERPRTMGGAYLEADEEKGKNLQEATRLVKDRKAFPIWLMQPDA